MKAKVRLFARLSELAGVRETEVETGEGLTVAEAYRQLCLRFPALATYSSSLLYAVNTEYVAPEHPLGGGDELALIPPVSGGSRAGPEPARPEHSRRVEGLFEVTRESLDPARLVDHVRKDESGAVVLFFGVVRDNSMGRRVLHLEYDAYPQMAEKVMRQLAQEGMERWPLTDVAMQHRIGRLEVGETSILIAVSSSHRQEAFQACHYLIDRFKQVVPVWKKEVLESGEVWVEGEAVER